MIIVVDANIAIKWAFQENHSKEARSLLDFSPLILAPDFIMTEISNIIWKKVLQKALPDYEAQPIYLQIQKIISSFIESRSLLSNVIDLSIELNHPIYDCIYLATAQKYNVKVLTADRRFYDVIHNSKHSDCVEWIEDVKLQY